jgi:hypothetical protein
MPSGGHSRSGPPPTPGSGRSDALGRKFSDLPAEGYDGEAPEFPRPVVFGSELAHWDRAWRTPQAALWATPQWSWVVPAVAHYCSLMAQSELAECPIGVHAQIRSREADILLTNDSLNRAGYRVVANQVSEKRDERATQSLSAVPEYDPRAEISGA